MLTGPQAAANALATTSWPLYQGYTACLNWVTWMYDKAGTGYQNANDAWNDARNSHHPTSEAPPIGAIGAFTGGPNGDVVIYVGGAYWRGVNTSTRDLRCVTQTTAEREAATGNRYVGWLGGLGGEAINFSGTTTAGDGITPIGDDMSWTETLIGQTPSGPAGDTAANWLTYTRKDVAAILAGQTALTAAVQALAAAKGLDGPALSDLIASKVDAALADNFAKTDANVDQIPTGFNITPK